MKKKEIKIKDLLTMLNEVSISYGSAQADFDDKYIKPITKLIYNHVLDMKIKDINEVKLGRGENLYHYLLAKHQPLIFSILTEKGAFKELYSTELLKFKKIIEPLGLDNNFHYFVYLHESCRERTKSSGMSNEFIRDVVDYLEKEKDINKRSVIINYMLDNESKNKIFINQIVNQAISSAQSIKNKEKPNFLNEVIQAANKRNINILKENYLNRKYLDNMENSFFISTINKYAIELMVNEGFKFNNKDYEYHNKSLISNVIDSGREEWLTLILPSVDTINCPQHLKEEQDTKILNMDDKFGKYADIKNWYLREMKKTEIKEIIKEMEEKEGSNLIKNSLPKMKI